jgi:hypothetical protein
LNYQYPCENKNPKQVFFRDFCPGMSSLSS